MDVPQQNTQAQLSVRGQLPGTRGCFLFLGLWHLGPLYFRYIFAFLVTASTCFLFFHLPAPLSPGGGCCQPVYRFLSWLTPSLTSQTSCGGECSPGVLTAAQSPAPGHLLLFPLPVPSPGWAPLFTISLWGFRALQQKGVKPSASVFYPQQSTKCLAVLFFITCLPHPQTHFANSPIRPPTSPCCSIRWSRFPLY